MRKEFLEKRLKRLTAKKEELKKRGLESSDAAEVRSINEQLAELDLDIEEINDEIRAIDEEEETRANPPANAQQVNGGVVGSFGMGKPEEKRDEEPTEKMEYRKAFMKFVQNGTPIPAELRAGAAIGTTDTQAAIPITIMREVINTARLRYGNIYSKVRKTNLQGGVEYPVGDLQATFSWINQSTVSPDQKTDALGTVMFSYHAAEIKIAQTFVSYITTLESFEAELTRVIATAYVRNMDTAIVAGTGKGMPLGIINDPRVTAAGHVVEMSAADINNWMKWRKDFFAKLPLGYRSGEFIFPVSTVDAYLETISDANGNPIFRQATGLEVNDGDAIDPNGRFFGRRISLVEPDIMPDFDTASNGDVIGAFWQPDEYAVNENLNFFMQRYFNQETNEWVDKALVIADGKLLNPNGVYLIKKKA